jgi:hypothetical protein
MFKLIMSDGGSMIGNSREELDALAGMLGGIVVANNDTIMQALW